MNMTFITVCLISEVTNLLRPISPTLFDSVSGPDVVIVLCQHVNNVLVGWTQSNMTQVNRGRSVATGQFKPESTRAVAF